MNAFMTILFTIWVILTSFMAGRMDLWRSAQFKAGFDIAEDLARTQEIENRPRCFADGVAFAIMSKNPRQLYRKMTGVRFHPDVFYPGYRHRIRQTFGGVGGPR